MNIDIHHSVYFLKTPSNAIGQRIDNFLFKYLKGIPKSRIYRLLRKGEVRVNKKRVNASYRLLEEDNIRIPPVRLAAPKGVKKPGQSLLTYLENNILYEDKQLLIINKPAGVAVHGGSGLSYGIIEAMRMLRPKLDLELVHRLDRETSGCLMLSKKRSMLRYLHELLRNNQIDKRYHTLLCGRLEKQTMKVQAALIKNTVRSGERIVRVSEAGKPASSIFQQRHYYSKDNLTLAEVRLLTGRTHQIRVHAQYMGTPLAGDEKYGNRECNQKMKQWQLKRLFLHAASLRFDLSDQSLHIDAPLPDALRKVIEQLQ